MTALQLKAIKHEMGWTIHEMATELGLSDRAVAYMLSGGRSIPLTVELALNYLVGQTAEERRKAAFDRQQIKIDLPA